MPVPQIFLDPDASLFRGTAPGAQHGRGHLPACADNGVPLPATTPPASPAALRPAVPVPPVAPATEEEHLPALWPTTHHESQRVHGPGAGQKLDVRPDSCDLFSRRTVGPGGTIRALG